jgi:hypothetical protein
MKSARDMCFRPGTTVAHPDPVLHLEVLVTRFRLRATVLTLSLLTLSLLAAPAVAEAQRRAVRVVRSRPAVIAGARFYSPRYFYRPFGYYDPWFYPYSYSLWYGGGYPFYQYPYGGFGGYYDLSSSLRLQVTPREAQVYIDGYYAGSVDNFDGVFQRLRLEPGEHNLEVFMPGHRSFTQKVYLQPGTTFRVRHTMEPLAAGEPEPTPPAATPRPAQSRPEPYGRPDRPNARGSQRSLPRDRAGNAESEFGSIALRVQPGDASVTIDGERWEGAQDQDRLVVQLGEGTHTVEIRKDGYRTYITDITVRPGETTPLNVSLTRQ